jgi:hypothetical protein
VVLWSLWGLAVAGLILVLDRTPLPAALWAAGGVLLGSFGWGVLRPFYDLFEWYHRRFSAPDAWPGSPAAGETEMDPDEEQDRFCAAAFGAYVALPPLFGLFYGVLLGPLVGALGPLDSSFPAAVGAGVGVLVGPMLVSFLAGLALACVARLDRRASRQVRLARRGLLVVSPVLIFPAAWACLRRG